MRYVHNERKTTINTIYIPVEERILKRRAAKKQHMDIST